MDKALKILIVIFMGVILLLIFEGKRTDKVYERQVEKLEAEISDLQEGNLSLYTIMSQDSIKLLKALKKTDSVMAALNLKDAQLKQLEKDYENDINKYFDYDFDIHFKQFADNLSN